MNSSHQIPFMDKTVPEWLLKNSTFMEQVKKEKEQRVQNGKQEIPETKEAEEQDESSSKAKVVELD
jgi:hypothetical protein